MTDKKKIKEEIESYKESMKGLEPHSDFRRGQLTAYNHILQFIDSLPKEPASEDLKKEILKWLNHYISVLDNNLRIDLRDIEVTANHFAEWQKQKDLEDSLKSDMTMPNKFYEKGRFDMREEMMKNAVDGEYWDGSIYLDNRPTEYKDGENMKIIIVNKEQQ